MEGTKAGILPEIPLFVKETTQINEKTAIREAQTAVLEFSSKTVATKLAAAATAWKIRRRPRHGQIQPVWADA